MFHYYLCIIQLFQQPLLFGYTSVSLRHLLSDGFAKQRLSCLHPEQWSFGIVRTKITSLDNQRWRNHKKKKLQHDVIHPVRKTYE